MDLTRRMSIRTGLALVVLAAVLPCAAMSVYSGFQDKERFLALATLAAQRTAEGCAEIQARSTENARQLLAALAAAPRLTADPGQEGHEFLAQVLAQNPVYNNILVVRPDGQVACSARELAGPPLNLADRSYFAQVLATKSFTVGHYVLAKISGTQVLPMAYPVLDGDGRVKAVLTVGVRLDRFESYIDSLSLPPGAVLGMTDPEGRRIFRYPQDQLTSPQGVPITPAGWAEMQKQGDRGTVTYTGQDGVRRIYAFRKLRLSPESPVYMVVFVGLPQARLLTQARAIVARELGLLGLATAVSLGLAWWLGLAVIGRKLKAVAETAGRVREGDLTARTGLPHDPSELGQVARTVDEMAQALAERSQEQALAEAALRLSLREKEVLLKEIHHRVKNNLQIVASLISLQSLEMEGLPQAQEALSSLGDRVRSMALVHERLYMSGDFSAVDMGHYLMALVGHIAAANKQVPAKVEMDLRAKGLRLSMDKALPCGLALSEMITNAYKHAFAPGQAGTVRVGLRLEDGQAVVSVADDGRGLSPDKPRPQTLGLQLVDELTAQLHGELRRLPGPGTGFELRFPV